MNKEKEMTNERKADVNTIMQVLQVLVLGIGLAGVFVRLGASQANIEYNNLELVELKEIAQDLVKAQLEFVSTDAKLEERMNALRARVDKLESSR